MAYVTHFRALLEFFHEGKRPSDPERQRAGVETEIVDIKYSSFTNEKRPGWTDAEIRGLDNADKLAGHLSEKRLALEKSHKGWGTPADLALLQPHIEALLAKADPALLPRTHRALRRVQK